jgi:hypothetical protein
MFWNILDCLPFSIVALYFFMKTDNQKLLGISLLFFHSQKFSITLLKTNYCARCSLNLLGFLDFYGWERWP